MSLASDAESLLVHSAQTRRWKPPGAGELVGAPLPQSQHLALEGFSLRLRVPHRGAA